jgi:hypothetical protein
MLSLDLKQPCIYCSYMYIYICLISCNDVENVSTYVHTDNKDRFYEELDHMKMLLGDFNDKVGREDILKLYHI